jgi:iron complex outermembrane receptor protein
MLGGPVDASFFVTNLLDETYATSIYSLYNQPFAGVVIRQLGEPRMFGARLKLRFGADAQ